uniref:Peptidase M13 N-terminal domain-containing protein n=1 Tax=Petromyzon marinus TaxID=7757 RepID=S4RL21_PETMA
VVAATTTPSCAAAALITVGLSLCVRTSGVCLSERCVRVAAGVLASMDRTVEPCQDFYGFACGRWERLNPLPDGHSRWTTFSSVWRQNQATLKHLL